MLKNTILSGLSLLILLSCSEAKFAVVNMPQVTYEGQIIRDIDYGDHQRQKLDIYIPQNANTPLPAIVFFHGGRWTFGSKDQYKFVGMSLSEQGYIVVLPNTRLYPEVKFPTFVEDGAQAVAWVQNNIAEYGGNDTLFLSGHSSGAHIAALITADETYLNTYDLNPNRIIDAFAGLAGPYDFVPEAEDIKNIFGPPSNYQNMQVTSFIDGNEPPMLLLHTANDETVHTTNLEKLKAEIEAENGQFATKIYPRGDHTDIVAALSWVNPKDITVIEDLNNFFMRFNASHTARP